MPINGVSLRGTKVCIISPGHMTKMAAEPIYGKNLKISSSLEPADRFQRKCIAAIRKKKDQYFPREVTIRLALNMNKADEHSRQEYRKYIHYQNRKNKRTGTARKEIKVQLSVFQVFLF